MWNAPVNFDPNVEGRVPYATGKMVLSSFIPLLVVIIALLLGFNGCKWNNTNIKQLPPIQVGIVESIDSCAISASVTILRVVQKEGGYNDVVMPFLTHNIHVGDSVYYYIVMMGSQSKSTMRDQLYSQIGIYLTPENLKNALDNGAMTLYKK
jgi:hypothetical protein